MELATYLLLRDLQLTGGECGWWQGSKRKRAKILKSLWHGASIINIVALIDAGAERHGERPCVYHGSGFWSYRELRDRVRLAAARLQLDGVAPGSVVAHSFRDESQLFVSMLATAWLGATVFSVPIHTPVLRRSRTLMDVHANFLATDIEGLNYAGLQTVRPVAGVENPISPVLGDPAIDPEAPWVIAIGSGSTGRPKYLPVTHRQQMARVERCESWLPYSAEDILLPLGRLDFLSTKQRYLEVLGRGAAVWIPGRTGELDLRESALRGKYTVLNCTVFHITQILDQLPSLEHGEWLEPLSAIMIGGSAVSDNLRRRIRDALCPRLYIRYASNECSTIAWTELDDVYDVAGGVGRPRPDLDFQIVDGNDEVVPIGDSGFVRVRSPMCIDGYLGDPQADTGVFRDGWFYPGDIARLTPEGVLVHLGRADDMMIYNGINTYPREVESALLDHPAVEDAVVRSIPHTAHQDLPIALVKQFSGNDFSSAQLLQFLRERLGGYMLHELLLVDRIPRNEQGKIRLEELRALVGVDIKGGASNLPLSALQSGRKRRQVTRPVQATFRMPADPNLTALEHWLAALGEWPDGIEGGNIDSEEEAIGNSWLYCCLRVARVLLQAARIPVFSLPRVLECRKSGQDQDRWACRFELPWIDHIRPQVFDNILKHSFRLAEWMSTHPTSLRNRRELFEIIQKQVLAPCEKYVPPGKSSIEVLRVAYRRCVPFRALGAGVYQLGWGAEARRIDRSTTDHDSAMGSRLAQSKVVAAQLLRDAGLPAPVHRLAKSLQEAQGVAEVVGWPVVVKPADQDRGEGVTVDVHRLGLASAFEHAMRCSVAGQVIVERQVAGVCHRLFVVEGELLYAVKRMPMGVYGDGERTVAELVGDQYEVQQSKPPWLRSEIRPLDQLALAAIKVAGFSKDEVPAAGQFVPLRRIESTAWGGVDEDVTKVVHPENVRLAVATTELFGLHVAGIDVISSDITLPWYRNEAIVNEVNYAPLLGGAEISRQYIDEYLQRLLAGDGCIPVEVFIGGNAAWEVARTRWDQLREEGVAVFLSNALETLDQERRQVPIRKSGLYHRVRALVLSARVQALILVVQTDELLSTGLPLEWVDSVSEVDRDISPADASGKKLPEARIREFLGLMERWPGRSK